MSPEAIAALVTLGNVFFTPIIVLVTMWVKNNATAVQRRENREDGFIQGLEDRVAALEKRLDVKEAEVREIRSELKNRDAEYIILYKEHTTLKAKYEVLVADHDELKRQYKTTASELNILKRDMHKRAEISVHTVKNLDSQTLLDKEVEKSVI